MQTLVIIIVLCLLNFCLAQTEVQRRQNIEYKRLSEATQRAFAEPDRPATISSYKSNISSTSSSYSNKSEKQSGSSNSYSSQNDNYSWAMTGQYERQQTMA